MYVFWEDGDNKIGNKMVVASSSDGGDHWTHATDIAAVNRLLKGFQQMQQMMKKMGKGGRNPFAAMMGGTPGGLPPGINPPRR